MHSQLTPDAGRIGTALADRYRVERELGAGGMATVYLAYDTKHDRKVAIKVLKPELAAVLGAERFIVEIKTTAALQHPHILPLFDSGTADGFLYYVMPYIEGETIREKLNRETQFGVDEAVRVAREVADGLDYAHRHGVIHRDIKPENILLHDGRAMVMDFGIALAVSAAAGGRMTETGLSLGTPHYMSPEQATAEKQITARSDVYSLASVLYEMLAGQPPHIGGSAQQVIMKIITEAAAPVNAMRKNVPPNVVDALAKALEKLPADRFESAHEFAEALINPSFLTAHGSLRVSGQPTPDARSWLRDARSRIAIGVIAGLTVLTFAARAFRPQAAAAVDQSSMVTRLSFSPSDRIVGPFRASNADRPSRTAMAISPDGKTLVFVGARDSVTQLFARPLNGESATPIPGTDGAESPFFSPDGRYVGYWSRQRLMRVPIAGGQPSQIAAIDRISGASWGHGDKIVVGVEDVGLIILSTNGAAAPDTLAERGATLPQFLPNDAAILFSTRAAGNGGTGFTIEAITIKGHKRTSLVDGADARYVPTGHIAFARKGTLLAAPFDASRLAITGTPVVVLDDVMQSLNGTRAEVITGAVQVAISPLGHLVYLSGGMTPDRSRQLAWLDRQGHATPIPEAGVHPFFAARLSPDERQVAITTMGQHPGVLIFDFARKTLLTLADTAFQLWPLWSSDGLRVVHRTVLRDSASLGWSLADGSRPATPFTKGAMTKVDPAFWSPDGKQLFVRSEPSVGRLSSVTLADGHMSDVENLPADAQFPVLSPDGKWIAYSAGEGGSSLEQVFVQPWPALDRKWKVSTEGGFAPAWTRDGRELVYLQALAAGSAANPLRVMATDVGGGATLLPQAPHELFTATFSISSPLRAYDVTKDGSRFLVAIGAAVHAPAGEPRMIVNWFAELRRLSAARSGQATP